MESEELKIFFSKLAERFWEENDLSDITWALCVSCPEFKEIFLSFFFGESHDFSKAILKREIQEGNSRPDFYIKIDQLTLIIEVKIYDKINHFDKYKTKFPGAPFGWIANYKPIENPPGVEIRTWSDLKKEIKNKSNEKGKDWSSQTKEIIDAYNVYLNEIFPIINYKKMNLENLQSLYFFNRRIEEIIRSYVGDTIKKRSSNFSFEYSGLYFLLSKPETPDKVNKPWFGIWYDDKGTGICMYFDQWGCESIFNGIDKNKTPLSEGTFYKKPHYNEDEDAYYFDMKEDIFNKLNKEPAPDQQKAIIEDFFKEVIEKVKQYI